MPSGWEEVKLGEVISHQKGFAFKSDSYTTVGVRIIRISDTTRNSIHDKSPVYINEDETLALSNYKLKAEDIILSTVGSRPHLLDSMVGKAVQIPIKDEGSLLNQNLVKLVPKNNLITNDYLFSMITKSKFNYFISTLVRGNANQVSITLKELFAYTFLLPTYNEQQKIAKILSTWDKAISTTECLINNSNQQKKALMQQLLTGKKRLLDESGKRFEGEWKSAKLSNFVVFKNGKGHENFVEDDGEYIVVNSKYISSDGRVVKKTNQGLNIAEKDDVLMVMSDVPNGKAIAKCFLVTETDIYTVNQRVALFRAKKIDPTFLYYILNRNSYYLRFDDGITQTNLRKEEVLACPVPNICNQEQQKIAAVLTNADKEIELLEQQLADLQQEKKALMQQLLTGKRRVLVEE